MTKKLSLFLVILLCMNCIFTAASAYDSGWSHFDYFVGSGIIWNYGYLAAAFFQLALNVELGTEVEENDVMEGGVAGVAQV